MKFKRAVDDFVLGLLRTDELPSAAIQALEEGHDSPSLRQLAALESVDPSEIRKLLLRALAELGLPVPSPHDAALSLARSIAAAVLNGNIAPYEGAGQIWHIYARFPELKQLTVFVGLASEYEDDEKHRDEYLRQIVEECKALLGASSC